MCDSKEMPNTEIKNDELNDAGLYVLPNGYREFDLLEKQNICRYLRGSYHTNDINSFVAYVEAHIGSDGNVKVFVNGSDMSATTYIDLILKDGKFGGKKHTATVCLLPDYKMAYISDLANTCKQTKFVDLLTMMPLENIVFLDSDKKKISHETAIGILSDLTIDRVKSNRVKVTNASRDENGSLSESIRNADTLPMYVAFDFSVYEGVNNGTMYYKIKYRTDYDVPMLCLEKINMDRILEECAAGFCSIIQDGFDGKAEVYIGDFAG